jgi:sugar/nucleoside kinase (ribokinase family)
MPAYSVRPVVNTIGAGDALFACFLHEYLLSRDPQLSLRKAQYFAAFKIGEAGAADGYLTANELNDMYEE